LHLLTVNACFCERGEEAREGSFVNNKQGGKPALAAPRRWFDHHDMRRPLFFFKKFKF
jgi:hypothetical protein